MRMPKRNAKAPEKNIWKKSCRKKDPLETKFSGKKSKKDPRMSVSHSSFGVYSLVGWVQSINFFKNFIFPPSSKTTLPKLDEHKKFNKNQNKSSFFFIDVFINTRTEYSGVAYIYKYFKLEGYISLWPFQSCIYL